MMLWTAQEISILVGCWPTASAAQISRRLNRSRASICGKAMRLRRGNLLPAEVSKNFKVKPGQTRLWPLGDVHQIVEHFCGETVVPGSPYCGHHLRIARYDRGLPHFG